MKHARTICAAVTIVVAAAVVYRDALAGYFYDDDFHWLVSSLVFEPSSLVDVTQRTHFFRPVIEVYFAVSTTLFGGAPALFHAANVALHAVNGLLLFVLARVISGSLAYALCAALFFVVQPADVEAVAWVGALAEPVGAFFGCLTIIGFLQFHRTTRRRWRILSLVAFALALLTHESSVVFLPLLLMADWAFVGDTPIGTSLLRRLAPWRTALGRYGPYAGLAAAYLAIDLQINSRNYVVTEGHYTVGVHVFTNAFEYIVGLYVGRRDLVNYASIAVGVPLLFLYGNRRVRFATGWLIVALLPFLFFTWGNQSRYLYLPAMGFGLLLAEGISQIDRLFAARLRWLPRAACVSLLVLAVTIRFMVFTSANVRSFVERTDEYRQYATRVRQVHGNLPPHSPVQDSRVPSRLPYEFRRALVQWEYRDPTIELIAEAPSENR